MKTKVDLSSGVWTHNLHVLPHDDEFFICVLPKMKESVAFLLDGPAEYEFQFDKQHIPHEQGSAHLLNSGNIYINTGTT